MAVLPATLLLLSPSVMGEVLGAPMGEEEGELVGVEMDGVGEGEGAVVEDGVGEGVTTTGAGGDDVGAGAITEVAACRYNYNIWTYSPIGVDCKDSHTAGCLWKGCSIWGRC